MHLALAVLGLLLQEETAQKYFNLKDGTTWTYDLTGDKARTTKVVTRVVNGQEGRIEEETEGLSRKQTYIISVKQGYLTMGAAGGGGSAIRLYKLGSKKGETWEGMSETKEVRSTATHKGTEKIKVSAGTYEDVLHVHLTMERGREKSTIDFFLAPKVGIVKRVEVVPWSRNALTYELKEFQEGK